MQLNQRFEAIFLSMVLWNTNAVHGAEIKIVL